MKPKKLLIGNNWVSTTTTEDVVNPYTGRKIASVYMAGRREMDLAIRTAQDAFEITKKQSSHERSKILSRTVHNIIRRKKEFVETIIAEAGKPRMFAEAEVERGISVFSLAAEEAKRFGGDILPLDIEASSKGRTGLVKRFPLGVIAGISPFNFPLNLVAHKVAPSLAVGNAIVLKPANKTPLTSLLLGECLMEAGMVPGSVNVVSTDRKNGQILAEDDRIKKLTFTGSPEVGWELKRIANKKKVTLELGGNAGVIVHDDADIDFAVKRVALGGFAYAGQVCISVQRVFVHEKVIGRFTRKLLAEIKSNIRTGDPRDPKTVVGPMIRPQALRQTQQWVKDAVASGAKILTGGKRKGTCYLPTVLVSVNPRMSVCCCEVFAPVITLESYNSFDNALKRVNDSRYGLQAGVFTKNIDLAFRAYSEIEAGGVVINDFPTFRVDNMPYGGVKDSGFGREGIRYAMEEMSEQRLMVLNLS